MTQNKSELLAALRIGACRFTYAKMDGEIRMAMGTLDPALIPVEHQPKTPVTSTNSTDETDLVKYYDMDVKGWRSFHSENLKSLALAV